jgi:TPR repeat protein
MEIVILNSTLDVCIIKAANKGNEVAQYNLGLIYETEDEFKDLQKAINWYQKAVDNNNEKVNAKVKLLNDQGYYAIEEDKGNFN